MLDIVQSAVPIWHDVFYSLHAVLIDFIFYPGYARSQADKENRSKSDVRIYTSTFKRRT